MQRALSGEALREHVFDSSRRLREAFIRDDRQLTGQIPLWRAAHSIRSAQLQSLDVDKVLEKYTGHGNKFMWLQFVQALEKNSRKYQTVAVSASTLSRSATNKQLLSETQAKLASGSQMALPPLLRVGSSTRLAVHRSPSLLLRMGPGGEGHPHGVPNFPAPPIPRAYFHGGGVKSLLGSSSSGSLRGSMSASQLRAAKLQQMSSKAELRAEEFNQRSTARLEKELQFQMRQQKAMEKRAMQAAAAAAGEMIADEAAEDPASSLMSFQPVMEDPDKAAKDAAQQAKRDKLKNTSFVKGASDALNSRFSDMFKAFQYVDLDRSGTLDKKEVRRALDMWNIPIDDEKLDDLILACDHDGDGQVDYKEFVDVLARDTVAPAAMGKRDMQSKEAMGVDSQEMLAQQLGHGGIKHYDVSINA